MSKTSDRRGRGQDDGENPLTRMKEELEPLTSGKFGKVLPADEDERGARQEGQQD